MAVRLLVIAEEKMLPALAAGLRESGRFEVATAATPEAAQAALAEPLDAAVVFYGTAQWSLPAALQALAPAREKGVHLVAVLQRQQAGQRDECFRNGASDAYFMPLPKDQFVGRLEDTVGLAYREDPGAKAAVQAASRTTSAGLEQAMVTAAGVHAVETLPFRPGHTVRLSWKAGADALSAWGLVARGDQPGAQVRFAGLTPEEDSRIRSWLKSAPTMELTAAALAPPARTTPSTGHHPLRAGLIPTMTPVEVKAIAPALQSAAVAAIAVPAAAEQVAPSEVAAKAPVTIDEDPPASTPAPAVAARLATPKEIESVEPAATPSSNQIVTPTSTPAAPLDHLFDDAGAAPTEGHPAAPEAAAGGALGTPWPEPWSTDWCRAAAMALLRNQPAPAGPEGGDKIARRIVDRTASEQRTAADPPGVTAPTSAADALVARIALAGAESAGDQLLARLAPVLVDSAAVTALTTLADAAGARLQGEANAAIAKGDMEALRLITALRGGLSQELLAFKSMVDQLRGLSVATLGASGLDPELQIGARPAGPRPKQQQQAASEPARRAAARFTDLDARTSTARKKVWLAVAFVVLVITGSNAFYFALPHFREVGVTELERVGAGGGVMRVALSANKRATVTVTSTWLDRASEHAPKLSKALQTLGVDLAILSLPDGRVVGSINTVTGKVAGVPRAAVKEEAAAPVEQAKVPAPHKAH